MLTLFKPWPYLGQKIKKSDTLFEKDQTRKMTPYFRELLAIIVIIK